MGAEQPSSEFNPKKPGRFYLKTRCVYYEFLSVMMFRFCTDSVLLARDVGGGGGGVGGVERSVAV